MTTAVQHTHQHTYTPTHAYDPSAVLTARARMNRAWDVYQELCDMREMGFASLDEVQAALNDAQAADDEYRSEYAEWQRKGGMSR